MSKLLTGIVIGVTLVLCAGAAYRIVVQPTVYTDVLDVNDQIYTGLSIEKEYLDKFGSCERTLLFYNVSYNRALINGLLMRIKTLEALRPAIPALRDEVSPTEIVDAPVLNEPNDPNVEINDEP